MHPRYYKEEAEGPWKEWTFGNLDGRALRKRDPIAVTINGVAVHTLQFGPYDEWDCVVGKKAMQPAPTPEPTPEPTPAPTPAPVQLNAQEYAMKVWRGQSDSLGMGERKRRIRAALEGQGLSMDGVKLPGD